VSFELKGAGRAEVFRFMEKLKMVVRATSLGDVHTLISIRPWHRIATFAQTSRRLGIRDNLMRISVGIEARGGHRRRSGSGTRLRIWYTVVSMFCRPPSSAPITTTGGGQYAAHA
jgi:cystathionine gamma-synthase/methionine-gamma-lyase